MGSKRRMQNLILEILNAQPSLRDSKTYLNSFAPRPRVASSSSEKNPQYPSLPANLGPTFFNPNPAQPSPNTADTRQQPFQADGVQVPPRGKPGALTQDTPTTPKPLPADQVSLAPSNARSFADSINISPIQQHTALVKVQGPFTDRQLASIAEGMVYLKKLGLVSVIMMDNEDWSRAAADFGPDGARLQDDDPWLDSVDVKGKGRAIGRGQEGLRRRMIEDTFKFADMLVQKGAAARPIPQAIVRVDAESAAAAHDDAPGHFPETSAVASTSALPAASTRSRPWDISADAGERNARTRTPLVSDDGLASLRSALASDQIPVLPPFALYEDPDEGGALRTVCVRADDVMVGLARDMAAAGRKAEDERRVAAEQGEEPMSEVDLMPLRLMVM